MSLKLAAAQTELRDAKNAREKAESNFSVNPDEVKAKIAVERTAEVAVKDEAERLGAIKAKTIAEVSKVVDPFVLGMLKDRKQTLDSYEQAIMFIGDAPHPKDSLQKQSE